MKKASNKRQRSRRPGAEDILPEYNFSGAVRNKYASRYAVEWDPAKTRLNLQKHDVSFADAVGSLEDEGAITIRDPFSDEEERWITMGLDASGRVLVVIHSWRNDNVRIISARKATPRERRQYEETNETRI